MLKRLCKRSKLFITFVLVLSLIFSNVIYTNAEDGKTLEYNGLEFSITQSDSSYILTCKEDGYEYQAQLKKLSNKIHIICNKDSLLTKKNIYDCDVDIKSFDKKNSELEYVLTDNNTGIKKEINDSKYLQGQAPIVWGAIALADLIAALLYATAVTVELGIMYYNLTDVLSDIQEDAPKNQKYYYYAKVQGSQLLIGSAFANEAAAITYARSNIGSSVYGIFCIGYVRAMNLAATVSPEFLAYTDGKHVAADGYRPHYHPRLGTSGMLHYDLHCWY